MQMHHAEVAQANLHAKLSQQQHPRSGGYSSGGASQALGSPHGFTSTISTGDGGGGGGGALLHDALTQLSLSSLSPVRAARAASPPTAGHAGGSEGGATSGLLGGDAGFAAPQLGAAAVQGGLLGSSAQYFQTLSLHSLFSSSSTQGDTSTAAVAVADAQVTHTRFSKSSGCSVATSSALNGLSPAMCMSPASSFAAPLMDTTPALALGGLANHHLHAAAAAEHLPTGGLRLVSSGGSDNDAAGPTTNSNPGKAYLPPLSAGGALLGELRLGAACDACFVSIAQAAWSSPPPTEAPATATGDCGFSHGPKDGGRLAQGDLDGALSEAGSGAAALSHTGATAAEAAAVAGNAALPSDHHQYYFHDGHDPDADAAGCAGATPASGSCPTSITVDSSTDAMQAAGLINFALMQPGVSSFVLVAPLGATTSPGTQATLCAALRAAVAARRFYQSSGPPTDLALMPVFATVPASAAAPLKASGGKAPPVLLVDCINLHIYHVRAELMLPPGLTPVVRVEVASNPVLLAMCLAQMVLRAAADGRQGGMAPLHLARTSHLPDKQQQQCVEVMFGPAAARVAMQALMQLHQHLAAAGCEAILLPSHVDGGSTTLYFSVHVVPRQPTLAQLQDTAEAEQALSPQQEHAEYEHAKAMHQLLEVAAKAASASMHCATHHSPTSAVTAAASLGASPGVPGVADSGPVTATTAAMALQLAHQQQQPAVPSTNSSLARLAMDSSLAGASTASGFSGLPSHSMYRAGVLGGTARLPSHCVHPDDAIATTAAAHVLAYHQQALAGGSHGPGKFNGLSFGAPYGLHGPENPHAMGMGMGHLHHHHSFSGGGNLLHSPPPPLPFAALPFGSLGISGVLEAAAAVAAAADTAAMQQQAAAVATAAAATAGGPSSSSAATASSALSRLRARKADWVIVTEDTVIKNAAGAIAKVLTRMAPQGLCCPVFMERKTPRYMAVVSVAVKAIAVARSYVSNEGSGHEVGFQPYFRGDPSACAFGACRPPGTPSISAVDAARSKQAAQRLNSQLGSLVAAGNLAALELLQTSSAGSSAAHRQQAWLVGGGSPTLGLSPRGSSPSLVGGGSPAMLGGSPPGALAMEQQVEQLTGVSGGSSLCGDDEGAGPGGSGTQWVDLEQTELAFDVYKVMLHQEIPEGGNLPVKVTAHSRPGVLSGIISKLVVERNSAVLITAGGRAMHVAMLAVVAARQRLLSQGIDMVLLPKFVTVNTTSTLGWESVFLKFAIIRYAPAPALAAEMTHQLLAQSGLDTGFNRMSI